MNKLDRLMGQDEHGSKQVVLSCRHVYMAHKIKLYQIQNNVEPEWAVTADPALDLPQDILSTLQGLNIESLADLNLNSEDFQTSCARELEQLAQSIGVESLQQLLDYLAMQNVEGKGGQQYGNQPEAAFNKNDLQLENQQLSPDSNESLINQLKQMDSE